MFAGCMKLTKASRYFSLLARMDLSNYTGRNCVPLRLLLQGGPEQTCPAALEA